MGTYIIVGAILVGAILIAIALRGRNNSRNQPLRFPWDWYTADPNVAMATRMDTDRAVEAGCRIVNYADDRRSYRKIEPGRNIQAERVDISLESAPNQRRLAGQHIRIN